MKSKAGTAAVFSFLALFLGLAQGQEQATAGKTAPKYVGPVACKACHEEIYNNFEKSPHWRTMLNKRGGPPEQGCEA